MTLPTFNRERTCPKCGGEASVAYVADNEHSCLTSYAPHSALPDYARDVCHYYRGEHLHRRCRCGYTWAEAVMGPS
jgi:hypothetical protein